MSARIDAIVDTANLDTFSASFARTALAEIDRLTAALADVESQLKAKTRINHELIRGQAETLANHRAALAEAEDRGAAQMRERAIRDLEAWGDIYGRNAAETVRALPLREPGETP